MERKEYHQPSTINWASRKRKRDELYCSTEAMHISTTVSKKSTTAPKKSTTVATKPENQTPAYTTLSIINLEDWMTDLYLQDCFMCPEDVHSVKIIRDKMTGLHDGYVEFSSHAVAEKVLQTYNGRRMPGARQPFRLNWAPFGIGERRPDAGPEHSIFVGNLAPDVTNHILQETFRAHYPSVRSAKVITDPNTAGCKGYGFVKFSDENERNRSMREMDGVYCSSRPMRVSEVMPKKSTSGPTKPVNQNPVAPVPINTTIFVGNLDPKVSEDELKQNFLQFGEIVWVKILPGKGCGFVQFRTRESAEDVILNRRVIIGQRVVRISWGRTLAARQGSDAYGYGAAQDPYSLNTYGGYQQYPQQVEGAQDPTSRPGSKGGIV